MIHFGYHSAPDKTIPRPKKGVLDYVMEYTAILLLVLLFTIIREKSDGVLD